MDGAVPVVDVMSGRSDSLLEALALSGNGGMGGGNGIWFLFLLLALGGGGFGGWGGNRGVGSDTIGNLITSSAVASAKNEAGLDYIGQTVAGIGGKLDGIIAGQYQNTINLGNAICNLGYQGAQETAAIRSDIANCCCSTKLEIAQFKYDTALQFAALTKQISDEGCATRQYIAAQRTADLERELADAKMRLLILEKKDGGC
jgi:hypothetical protein